MGNSTVNSTMGETPVVPRDVLSRVRPFLEGARTAFRGFPVPAGMGLALVLVFALASPLVAPRDPVQQDLGRIFHPPFWQTGGSTSSLLGTDILGRDIFSRLIYGARISLIVGFGGVALAATLGVTMGILSGYLRGVVDTVIMRVIDMQLGVPPIMFLVLLAMFLGPGLGNVILVLVVWSWAHYARVIRGEVLSLRERDFVMMGRVAGSSQAVILRKHILPNILNTALVLASVDVGTFIILEATISFLGIGIRPPTPAWGVMVAEARNYLTVAWWAVVFPGLMIMISVLSANLLGDWVRDRLDPVRRQL